MRIRMMVGVTVGVMVRVRVTVMRKVKLVARVGLMGNW